MVGAPGRDATGTGEDAGSPLTFLLCIQPGILANRAVLFTFRVGLSSLCKPFCTRPEVCFHVDIKLSLVDYQD